MAAASAMGATTDDAFSEWEILSEVAPKRKLTEEGAAIYLSMSATRSGE